MTRREEYLRALIETEFLSRDCETVAKDRESTFNGGQYDIS